VKTIRTAASRTVPVIACAAAASSVVLRLEGWPGWVLAALILTVEVALWNTAMAPGGRWRVSRVSYYSCKFALYCFATLVLWYHANAAGMAFVAAIIVTESLELRSPRS
jgi:hypothetical protein